MEKHKCRSCKKNISQEVFIENLKVCPYCNYHEYIGCRERINITVDQGSFSELDGDMKSVDILVMLVLGGLGSISGSIVSSIVLTFLPEFLRFLADSRLVVFSFLLIIIMLFRPSGLMGNQEVSVVKFLQEFSFKNMIVKLGNIKLKKAGEDR